jgi:glycosyltransferase involved in cell wall biosynthesis
MHGAAHALSRNVVTTPDLPPIVFDLRGAAFSGLGRVARETVAAYQRLFPSDQVTVLRKGGAMYSWRAQREWPSLRRAFPDAVWVWFHWDVPLWAPPARSVVYVHDLIVTDTALTPWLKREIARRWIARACSMATELVTVSEATAAQIRAQYGRTAAVIPNGVSPTLIAPWTAGDYLLTVGEPRSYKNFEMAERVARALGVSHRHAWGVPECELHALYANARVVLIPSRAEGFGLPLLEAFASGAPVVASDIPALVEVSCGLASHVAPDDFHGWCKAVRVAWDESGDSSVRQDHAHRFTWERAATQLRYRVQACAMP